MKVFCKILDRNENIKKIVEVIECIERFTLGANRHLELTIKELPTDFADNWYIYTLVPPETNWTNADKWRVEQYTKLNDNKGVYYKINATHYLCELLDESKATFTLSSSSASNAITQALSGTTWSSGTVNVTGTESLEIERRTTVLEILQSIASKWNGELYFRNDRKVDFKENVGSDNKLWFRTDKNIKSLKVEYDAASIITRLYIFGKDGLDIASINGGLKYLDSTYIGNYPRPKIGVKETQIDDKIKLKAFGEDYLSKVEIPRVIYEIDITDLSTLTDYPNDKFEIGDTITVHDNQLNIRVSTRIKEITRNYCYPEQSSIRLANTAELLSGYLADQRKVTKVYLPPAYESVPSYTDVPWDDTEPAVPIGLSIDDTGVKQNDDGIWMSWLKVNWTANTEDDFSHYEVSIRQDTGNYKYNYTSTNSIWIYPLLSNTTYYVAVRAIDKTGNKSAWCTETSDTTAKDTQAPAVPAGLSASAGFKKILLEWNDNTEADFSHYELYRNTTDNSGSATKLGDYKGSIIAVDGNKNATYYFWLKSVDFSGNKSAFTSSVNATTVGIDMDEIDLTLNPNIFVKNVESYHPYGVNQVILQFKVDKTNKRVYVKWVAGSAVTQTFNKIKFKLNFGIVNATSFTSITFDSPETMLNLDGSNWYSSGNGSTYGHITVNPGGYDEGYFTFTSLPDHISVLLTIDDVDRDGQKDCLVTLGESYISHGWESKLPRVYRFWVGGEIETEYIANLAVSNAKIADLAVTEAKIANLAVSTGKIANLAVDTGKIANLAVSTGKIADLAVTDAKIDTLTSGKVIVSGSTTLSDWRGTDTTKIEGAEIETGTVTLEKLVAKLSNNILRNTSFESWTSKGSSSSWSVPAMPYWVCSKTASDGRIYLYAEGAANRVEGTYVLRMRNLDTNTANHLQAYSNPLIRIQPSTKYTLSVYLRRFTDYAGIPDGQIIMQWFDSSEISISTTAKKEAMPSGATSTNRWTLTGTSPSNAYFVRVYLRVFGVTNPPICNFECVQLEEGGEATPWNEAGQTIIMGETIRSGNIILDGETENYILIKDKQATPKNRVKLGKVGTATDEYGLLINDESGNTLVNLYDPGNYEIKKPVKIAVEWTNGWENTPASGSYITKTHSLGHFPSVELLWGANSGITQIYDEKFYASMDITWCSTTQIRFYFLNNASHGLPPKYKCVLFR